MEDGVSTLQDELPPLHHVTTITTADELMEAFTTTAPAQEDLPSLPVSHTATMPAHEDLPLPPTEPHHTSPQDPPESAAPAQNLQVTNNIL